MSTPIDPPLSRRAARQSEVTVPDAPPEPFAQPLTRRARAGAPASVPSAVPGEVSYRTDVRPRVPHYDAPPLGHAVNSPEGLPIGAPGSPERETPSASAAAFIAPPLVEPPVAPPAVHTSEQMRRRDFRPPTEQFAPDSVRPVEDDSPLEYHTQLTAGMQQPPVVNPAVVDTMTAHPLEQTLSRRELREMRDRSGLTPEPSSETEAFGALPLLVSEPLVTQMPLTSAPLPPAPTVVLPSAITVDLAPPALSEPPAPSVVPAAPDVSTGSHWSVGIHDNDDPFENTFSREVGSAVSLSNTNALVLPEMPMGGISGPVAGTGEIIITGMIDLPRVVSSTGTVPTVHESPDIDDLFDPGDLAAGPADAAPVSALKAISSHTAARSVIMTGKRSSSNTVTTVLVASTVVMAVVAIGLFVLAAVNGLF